MFWIIITVLCLAANIIYAIANLIALIFTFQEGDGAIGIRICFVLLSLIFTAIILYKYLGTLIGG